jgi:hypothetical protein
MVLSSGILLCFSTCTTYLRFNLYTFELKAALNVHVIQIGLSLCPLSNDSLFLKLKDSPIGHFHRRGLRVCIGTDDPLQFHLTDNPLVEEYLVSSKMFDWNIIDMSELARNSVLVSCFDHEIKSSWLGPNYHFSCSIKSSDANYSNVPLIRSNFRQVALLRELVHILQWAENRDGVPQTILNGTRVYTFAGQQFSIDSP